MARVYSKTVYECVVPSFVEKQIKTAINRTTSNNNNHSKNVVVAEDDIIQRTRISATAASFVTHHIPFYPVYFYSPFGAALPHHQFCALFFFFFLGFVYVCVYVS